MLTMAVLALLEDTATGRIRNEREFGFATIMLFWLLMMTGLSADSDFQFLELCRPSPTELVPGL